MDMKYNLPVVYLQEGKYIIAYTPALDLSTQGRTLEEAKKNFHEAVELWFESCVEMGTLEKALANLGWQIRKSGKHKGFMPPRVIQNTSELVSVAAA